jgi:hypothetical protein
MENSTLDAPIAFSIARAPCVRVLNPAIPIPDAGKRKLLRWSRFTETTPCAEHHFCDESYLHFYLRAVIFITQ